MERPVSMPPPRAESPRPIPPPRRDVPIKIAPVPGSRVESPRHSPRHASPRSSNSNGSPVGSSPRSSNTPLTSSVRVELSPKPLRTSLGGSQSAESSPRGETASSSEQRRSPRPSSAILSKSPRISTSPRPNSPYLQLVPSQPQSSLTEDFAFKSRALLRFFCRDAVNSSLPDELFTAFVPSCSLLSKSSNPPHLDLEVLLERELDRLPGEKVCRFDRLCSLVWSIDHHDEEVFVRAGRIVKVILYHLSSLLVFSYSCRICFCVLSYFSQFHFLMPHSLCCFRSRVKMSVLCWSVLSSPSSCLDCKSVCFCFCCVFCF
jgi:hypothetical protein